MDEVPECVVFTVIIKDVGWELASSGFVPVAISTISSVPSPSSSGSTLLPTPSPSVSVISLGSNGKASLSSLTPSPSVSAFRGLVPFAISTTLDMPSPSISGSTLSKISSQSRSGPVILSSYIGTTACNPSIIGIGSHLGQEFADKNVLKRRD